MKPGFSLSLSVYIFLLTLIVPAFAQPIHKDKIIIWERQWEDREKIKTLLDYTVESFGPYELVKSKPMEQGRAIAQLQKNQHINLLWLPCSIERERKLLPVYIYMGGRAMGHRICMIKKGTQHLFDNISSLEDWNDSGLLMGTGTHWADTEILEYNKIATVKNPVYRNLYLQLAGGRFQAFPRGIDQIEPKLEQFGNQGAGLDLEIEQRLLFVYPFKEIIFVSRRNARLKKRIEAGYEQALRDGVWQPYFADKEENIALFRALHLKKRIVIPLDNPFLSKEALKVPMFDHDPLD